MSGREVRSAPFRALPHDQGCSRLHKLEVVDPERLELPPRTDIENK
jgi:hypothetical protein